MTRTSVLGGETRHRSVLGGSMPLWKLTSVGAAAAVGMVLTMFAGEGGFVVGVLLVAATWLLTASTPRGSVLARVVTRRRWKERTTRGTVKYTPFDQGSWDALAVQARAKSPQVRADAARQAVSLRDTPDGASGMAWLEKRPRRPGVAWHAPAGEPAYLSVAFEVSGQIRGLESDAATDAAAAGWGRFLARLGSHDSVARMAQTITRVLPPDSARHQAWLVENLDPDTPPEVAASYDELLRKVDASTMTPRHYVVIRWPLTSAFRHAAARHGQRRQGWRELMRIEVASMTARLRGAGHSWVRPLSAAQTAAVMLHMQSPSRAIDQVAGVDPDRFGVPSADHYSAHVVTVTDPATGQETQWWHRTARITAEAMATVHRSSLWMTALLSGTGDGTLRTLSFHTWVIPAAQARAAARLDRTRDSADRLARSQAGRIEDEETELRLSAAQRRARDLRPGEHHAGVEWVGYLTVSARSAAQLAEACRKAQATAADELGIERLEWLDTLQSAASGTTWPIARGMRPPADRGRDKVMSRMAGHGAKESL
ncbi:hypothetical protein M3148_16220 [Georgenia satyanarayanai]|uniref:SCO6880 family protein n=1 Tax=Georgenia satyanarayanai TaxID=860221 RepID=UPI00203F84CE|nr:SCO6880 family protein [Georgenia satyanarayanai]MCM3662524.1 hypothetical protein [Georgenia satyanarayanai]